MPGAYCSSRNSNIEAGVINRQLLPGKIVRIVSVRKTVIFSTPCRCLRAASGDRGRMPVPCFLLRNGNGVRMMKMKLSVLCENTVCSPMPFIGEHGLSLLIENETTTLYDTGQGFGLINNMKVLGKNPDMIDRIIISHGHYDHTGGLMQMLKARGTGMEVYCHPDAFIQKIAYYQMPGNNLEVSIGFQSSRQEYENAGAHFNWISGYGGLSDTLAFISDVARPEGWKTWDVRLKRKIDGIIEDDPFNDDLSLLVETESGPVVLLGCAHAGIVEILEDISAKSGHTSFHAVIGGTHLESASAEYFERTVEVIERFNVAIIGTSHCTGFKRSSALASHFKDRFTQVAVGTVMEF